MRKEGPATRRTARAWSGASKRRRVTPSGSGSERGKATQKRATVGVEKRKVGRPARETGIKSRRLMRKQGTAKEESAEDAVTFATSSEVWSDASDDGDDDYDNEAEARVYRKSLQAKQKLQEVRGVREKERERVSEIGKLVGQMRESAKERRESKQILQELQDHPSGEVEASLRDSMQNVLSIATTSKNLKGTYVKALKGSAQAGMLAR